MLMELARRDGCRRRSGSAKARLTSAWQSSNLPSTAKVVTLPPSVVICLRWRSETSSTGKSTTLCTRGTPWKAWATALPVSPDVAVRITSSPLSFAMKADIQRAIMRAAKSLNDAVGPRSRRIT